MYFVSPVFLNFWVLSLFLVNGPQALYVNPGYLKGISGINLSPASKNLLIKSFFFYVIKIGYLDFLVLYTTNFDNIIVPPFIDLKTNGLMLFIFSTHFRQ